MSNFAVGELLFLVELSCLVGGVQATSASEPIDGERQLLGRGCGHVLPLVSQQ
jgi:hypothetical protein